MRFFLDTEFAEDGRTIDLISIAVVAESGSSFYRQNADAVLWRANQWVQDHVIPKLDLCPSGLRGIDHKFGLCAKKAECAWRPRLTIDRELFNFVSEACDDGRPEFWGYYADYDWVALCQLYGKMIELPPGWPMYCRDLKQWADDLHVDLSQLPQHDEHHALSDARWNAEAWKYLDEREGLRLNAIYEGGILDAKGQEARAVDQEPGNVRSNQAGSSRAGKGGRRQNLQRRAGEGRQEGSSQVRQEDTPVGGISGILT